MSDWRKIGEPIIVGDATYTLEVSSDNDIIFDGRNATRRILRVYVRKNGEELEVDTNGLYVSFRTADVKTLGRFNGHDGIRFLNDTGLSLMEVECDTYTVCFNVHEKIILMFQYMINEHMNFAESFNRVFNYDESS
jgi:hypothetical protein